MSVDRDAWIFGLIVSGLAVAFTMPLLLEQGSVWSVVFVCLLFGLPAGVGYFIGYLRRRIPVSFKALFFAAGFAYLVTDSIARLLSF